MSSDGPKGVENSWNCQSNLLHVILGGAPIGRLWRRAAAALGRSEEKRYPGSSKILSEVPTVLLGRPRSFRKPWNRQIENFPTTCFLEGLRRVLLAARRHVSRTVRGFFVIRDCFRYSWTVPGSRQVPGNVQPVQENRTFQEKSQLAPTVSKTKKNRHVPCFPGFPC